MEKGRSTTEIKERVVEFFKVVKADQEKKPLRLAEQLGYLMYVRLFIESQKRGSLQEWFPYAGFPMEWTPGTEEMEDSQRSWQLQYQLQYCSSMVEAGHFMEQAKLEENPLWMKEITKLIDWTAENCDWEQGMPQVFGEVLEEVLRQMYDWGTTGLFLMPKNLTDALIQLADQRKVENVWNPAGRTGTLLAAAHKQHPEWKLAGCEEDKNQWLIARMIQFYHGGGLEGLLREDPLEKDRIDQAVQKNLAGETAPEYPKYDLILTNLPVGELSVEEQDRYWISTRKAQLQYLQMMMNHIKDDGMAVAVVNEGTLFMYDAEQKVRQYLLDDFRVQGVISLPAGAFLPYTGSKASVLIFTKEKAEKEDLVWFYELEQLGYSLDRKKELLDTDDIPAMLESWKNREILGKSWKDELQKAKNKNQWENPVPTNWKEKACWFASLETIRNNDNNLSAGRYKPWKTVEETVSESPAKLLETLAQLEQDTMKKVQELMEIARAYE